jgi:CDP-diacylglycerol pyrophosphatase
MYPSSRLSNDLATLWFQAPMVIAMRTQQMWMAAMTGGTMNAAELNRMVSEKMMAAAESAVAANIAMTQQSIKAMTAMATGTTTSSHRAADAVVGATVKPYSKRVRSNVRRLTRQKG